MKNLILLFCACLSFGNTFSQHRLQGTVQDAQTQPLQGATIVLLEIQDSSMIAFAISDHNGKFELEDIEHGSYLFQLSFVSYKNKEKTLIVTDDKTTHALGIFNLENNEEILQVVEVKAEHIPMGIDGDTINYNASAFKTRPGASVEDLLKKLPGVEVGRDGSIKAMGEDVENVLVDGKEFFGSDAKIATQNLEAEAVDKVQVFDKKSELAEFTGIDDGEDEKTINLKLKEEYKKGGFGAVEIQGGTDERYNGKLNYNRFNPKMQAAIIANANNINKQAFSFNDYIQFMGGLGNAVANNNGLINFGEFGQGSTPKGLTNNLSTGLNFNYDFTSKFNLRSHYFLLKSDRNLIENTISKEFSSSENFETNSSSILDEIYQQQRIQVKLEYKPSPFLQWKWSNNVNLVNNNESLQGSTQFFTNEISTGITERITAQNNNQIGLDGNIQLRKKFQKKGRNWIQRINYQIGEFEEDLQLDNMLELITPQTTVSQLQYFEYKNKQLAFRSVFTEPLGKSTFLSGLYNFEIEEETPHKTFYDIETLRLTLNEGLSGQFTKTNTIHKTQVSIRRNTKKTKINAGLASQWSTIKGQDINFDQPLINQNFYLLPSFSIEQTLSRITKLNVNYSTNINLPTLNQLAPLPDNSNPNIFFKGNPNLKPEFQQQIQLRYSIIDQFNFTNLFLTTLAEFTNNWINDQVSIDDNFLKTYLPINLDKHLRVYGNLSFNAPIKPLKIKLRANAKYSYSAYEGFLNELKTPVKEQMISTNLILENRKKEKIDLALGVEFNYNTRAYELRSDFDQQFLNSKFFIEADWFINDTWTLSSSYDFHNYSNEVFSEGIQFNLWNASLIKSFKDQKWELSLEAHDLLKQNVGLIRSGGLNGVYEQRFNTLSRYFLLGLKYKIGKKRNKSVL